MEKRQLTELRDEIQRLRDEQQRLRDEQEQLRRETASGNGKSGTPEHTENPDNSDNKHTQESSEPRGGERNAKEQNDNGEESRNGEGAQKQEQEQSKPKPPVKERARTYVQTHRKGVLLGTVGFIATVFVAIVLLVYLSSYESTDDAQVDGHLNSIGARITGTVTAVYIDNNQPVSAGQQLVDLDPRDYQVALDQAKAGYVQAVAQFRAENPNVPIVQTSNETSIATAGDSLAAAQAAVVAVQQDYQAKLAAVRQAEANNNKAQTDVQRYRPLVQREEVSHELFDTIVANAKTQAATVESAQAGALAAEKAIDESRAQLLQAQSRLAEATRNAPRSVTIRKQQLATREGAVLSARALSEQAALNLSYTKILAPVSGIVNEKTVEVGQRIQPGEQLFVITQLEDIWITANFKETQLKKMSPGQAVDVHVDTFDTKLHGYVESMPGATGSVMSLLPPENATGNFVKVVQRLPVRIRLNAGEDPQHRLRPGMSVEPKVWLK